MSRAHGRKARGPTRGDRYAAPGSVLPGVGPFDALVVAAVHRDGRLDLTLEGDESRTFTNVNPKHLTRIT